MSLLKARFLERDTTNPQHVGAATLPYSDTKSIREVLEPLLVPSIVVERRELTALNISTGRLQLSNDVARRDSVVVTVKDGIPQFYGIDFLVSEDSPNYVYWDGLALADRLAEGDMLMIQYEVAGIATGTPGVDDSKAAGFAKPQRISADRQVVGSETLLVDTSADVVTVYLPDVTTSEGFTVVVKMVTGENGIVISPFGTDMIDGVADDLVLDTGNASYTFVCDGEGWFIV